ILRATRHKRCGMWHPCILKLACIPTPLLFFFHNTPPTDTYTLSLHDALPISSARPCSRRWPRPRCCGSVPLGWPTGWRRPAARRSEEHTSELQSRGHLVCRLLLEKKKSTSAYHSNPD